MTDNQDQQQDQQQDQLQDQADLEYQAMVRRVVDRAPRLDEARAKRIAALLSGAGRDTLNGSHDSHDGPAAA